MALFETIISVKFEGVVWRLELDELRGLLFAEIRQVEDKTVSFASLNLISGEICFEALGMPERWLTGMEAAFDGVLLLHQYRSDDSPAHRGLTAIDAITSAALWSNFNISFDHLSVNGPVVYDSRFQPRKLFLADIHTGATRRPYEPSVDVELERKATVAGLVLPPARIPVEAYGNLVHYLEYNDRRIVSLHTLRNDQLQQELYIMDGDDILFKEVLNSGIQKMQPEAFMLFDDRLIYLKNKSEINVLKLTIL